MGATPARKNSAERRGLHDPAAGAPDGRGKVPPPRPAEEAAHWRDGYRNVVGDREFRALWVGHAVSMTGGNLLTVAAAVLVYRQTASAAAAGVTLALIFLPQVLGGPLLSGLADVLPRRAVMIACESLRSVLIAVIAVPGVPLWGVWTLLFLTILPLAPFAAARAALLGDIVTGERYVAGSAIINMTTQLGALAGLVVGGAVITATGPNHALLITALAFAASAAVVAAGVSPRPAPGAAADRPGLWALTRDGTRLAFGDPRLRSLVLLSWLAGFYVVPLGVAAPLADDLGTGPAGVGLLMAAVPGGALVGGFVLTKLLSPGRRLPLIAPLAVLASVPLLVAALRPPLWVFAAMLVISGMCGAYQFVANAAYVLCVPESGRGLAFGIAASGLQAAQGLGILLASLLADLVGAPLTVALAGAGGVLSAAALVPGWNRRVGEVIAHQHATEGR